MDGVHLYKSMLKVIRAGADVEKARRKLGRLGRRVKRTMIGQRIYAQCVDCTLLVCGYLCLDMVVACETCATQILSAVLNPFNRLAGRN